MSQDEAAERRTDVRGIVRDFIDATWDLSELRTALDRGKLDRLDLWTAFADDLGLTSILAPEADGESAGTLSDAEVVLEELGRTLAPIPFLMSSVVAVEVLARTGSHSELADVLLGTQRATLIDARASHDVTVSVDGNSARISGLFPAVLDGAVADIVLIVADIDDSPAILITAASAATRTPDSGLDPSLQLASLQFSSGAARVLSRDAALAARGVALVHLGIAALQAGTAKRALELTRQYAAERVQFGRLIGSFQAVKHRIADMLVATETAKSASLRAVRTLSEEAPTQYHDAALAAEWNSAVARQVTADTIQLHGGMGFTWEHDAHLLYRRAHALAALLDDPEEARDKAWDARVFAFDEDENVRNDRDEEVSAVTRAFIRERWQPGLSVREWWGRMAAARLTVPSMPESLGGRGWAASDESTINEVMHDAKVTLAPGGIGRSLAAPTIAAVGTEFQRERLLPRILDGTESWCQLFSEPDAGSDLAGLRVKAGRDGDGWRISGQKTWTSNAQTADWGLLLARTDPSAQKHAGLSYFLLPMRQSGVEVRPIKDMAGETFFNDVFLDDAWVSDEFRVGELGDGWKIANLTLAFERAGVAGNSMATPALPGELAGDLERPASSLTDVQAAHSVDLVSVETVRRLADLANEGGLTDPSIPRALVDLWFMVQVRLEGERRVKSGLDLTGAEPNVGKLHSNTTLRLARDTALRILGPGAALTPRSEPESWVRDLILGTPAPSIYGGTDEIQRNIIAERVLGLPREFDPSRTGPFNEVRIAK